MAKPVIERIPGAHRLARLLGLGSNQAGRRRFLLDMLPKASVGAEIGVHLGDFSREILDCVAPQELHLIDPWKHETSDLYRSTWYGGGATGGQAEMDERYSSVLKRFGQNIDAARVKVHRGRSADVLRQFPDQFFDWIYIDGNHLYEYVSHDLELSLRKVRAGGYITGDDYARGVWSNSGVRKAVDAFRTNLAVRLIEIRNQQFVFRTREAAKQS